MAILVNRSQSLYRIVGLEGFMSLLIHKEERFVRPIDSWPDTFEGYMLHQLDTNEGMKKVIERLYDLFSGDVNATILAFSKLLRSRYACYGLCWSKEPDSDAMWRIYSYDNKAIQLISDAGRINRMIEDSPRPDFDWHIAEVKYDIHDEEEALYKILVRNARIDSAYFHKRPAFEHEQEVRVLINNSNSYIHLDLFVANAIRKNMKHVDKLKSEVEQILYAVNLTVGKKEGYITTIPSDMKLKIVNLSEYFKGIRVHPQAPGWYVELVKKICRNYKVSFMGQSNLYRVTV